MRRNILYSMNTEERIQFIREERAQNEAETWRQKLLTRSDSSLCICISLDYMDRMSDKELRSLAMQVFYVFKNILAHEHYQVSITVSSFTEEFKEHCNFYGYNKWSCCTTSDQVLDVYKDSLDSLIMLSPDADVELSESEIREPNNTFIIGGLVDRTVCKGETRNFALRNSLPLRKFPIRSLLGKNVHPVLNVNTVAAILCAVRFDDKSLLNALQDCIPQRKQNLSLG
eukprot:Gregarina_sp_Poly_1__4357@NODE_235_length_10966_cov_193_557758_g208_i0_p5_GENE_NODE_235_length_10966_cov_193_557758_g208_i0NODE_235_length_10966_cov_193_557758_g208_i0_p5_ORF_typecomplete_len228_score31_01tRNA_m1G_MT/PF01746_21/1_7e11RNA_Me_trans/PF04252_13/5_5e07_NODE_235_length_10966_cov_193_557758_g208_i0223906